MATKTNRDPLSRYFKDLNDSDLDSDESEDENETKYSSKQEELKSNSTSADKSISKSNHNSTSSLHENEQSLQVQESEVLNSSSARYSSPPQTTKNAVKKLPSAHECFKAQSSPEFLMLHKKRDVDWDKSLKRLENDEEASSCGDYKSNAVPPPCSYEPITDPGIKVVDSEGRKRKTAADDPSDESKSSPTKAYRVEQDS